MRVAPRWNAERSWGRVSLEIGEQPDEPAFPILVAYDKTDKINGRIAVRGSELDGLIAALIEVRRLLLGHEKHAPKEADPVFSETAKGAGKPGGAK